MQKKAKLSILILFFVLVMLMLTFVNASNTVELLNANGSLNTTYTNITACANVVSAGQTCLVYAGNYTERVTISRNGSLGNWITFRALQQGTVIMQGFAVSGSYIALDGFNITNSLTNYPSTLNTGGIAFSGDYEIIKNNYIYNLRAPGIFNLGFSDDSDGSLNTSILDNKIYGCNKGIIIFGSNISIERNEVERLIRYLDDPADEDADYSRFFGNHIVFKNNWFHSTNDNETGDSHVDCFQTYGDNGEWVQDVIIERNICEGYFDEGLMSTIDGVDISKNITIRNNVFAGDGTNAWGLVVGIPYTSVYNNVFTNIAGSGVGFKFAFPTSNATGGIIKNNIFYNVSAAWGIHFASATGNYSPGTNLLYHFRNGTNILDNYSVGGYFSNYILDIKNQDPLFVNISNVIGPDGIPFTSDDGLRLSNNSPAIDAGEDLSAYLATDINGVTRPQGDGWDIGAYEDNSTYNSYLINITFIGTGNGSVKTTLSTGLNCTTNCTFLIERGRNLTLVPIADEGSLFYRWRQTCTGTINCTFVNITSAKNITVQFDYVEKSENILQSSRITNWSSNAGLNFIIPNWPNGRNAKTDEGAIGDGITDDTIAIRNCIANTSANTFCYLPPGVYLISGGISLGAAGSTPPAKGIRGAGPDVTTILASNNTGTIFSASAYGPSMTLAVTNITKGSKKIYINSSDPDFASYSPGDQIRITQSNGDTDEGTPSWIWSAIGQFNIVVAKGTDYLDLQSPIHYDYNLDYNVVVNRLWAGFPKNIGIENLTIDRQYSSSWVGGHNIFFQSCVNCWIKNVKSKNVWNWHVNMQGGFGNIIRDSWFEQTWQLNCGGNACYGTQIYDRSSDNLIENNVYKQLRHAMITESGGAGNIFGYSYSRDPINEGGLKTDYLMGDICNHGGHSFMNLYEGNTAATIKTDIVLGSNRANTFFRNNIQVKSIPTVYVAMFGIDNQASNLYHNYVGNVFGKNGSMTSLYRLGTWQDTKSGTMPSNISIPDLRVNRSMLSHGNVYYIGGSETPNGTIWDLTITNQSLIDSYYYSSRPSWYESSLQWPPNGPDIVNYTNDIPAKLCYEKNEMPSCNLSTSARLQFNVIINKTGDGTGTITGGAIYCGSACTATMNDNDTLILVATASSGSEFSGWEGVNCTEAKCTINITQNLQINATFMVIAIPDSGGGSGGSSGGGSGGSSGGGSGGSSGGGSGGSSVNASNSTKNTWKKDYSYNLSELKKIGQIRKSLAANERVIIKINGTEHHIGVKNITNSSATIEVASNPQIATLNINETKSFDIVGDSKYDISVKLNAIVNGSSDLTIHPILEDTSPDNSSLISKNSSNQTQQMIPNAPTNLYENMPYWLIVILIVILFIVSIYFAVKGSRKFKNNQISNDKSQNHED